jgi:hypothetical protein
MRALSSTPLMALCISRLQNTSPGADVLTSCAVATMHHIFMSGSSVWNAGLHSEYRTVRFPRLIEAELRAIIHCYQIQTLLGRYE